MGALLTKSGPSKISAGFWTILTGMDIQTIWIIVVAVSTPIAGVVGFAIQLRQVKNLQLQNKKLAAELIKLDGERERLALELRKLTLEIENLQHQLKKANNRIVVATDVDVLRYNDKNTRFSRKGQGPAVSRTGAPRGYKAGPMPWFAPKTISRRVLVVISCLCLAAVVLWLLLGRR